MNPLDSPPPADPPGPTAYGWCAWHRAYAHGVRLINVVEQGSGSGGNLFACPPCRTANNLVPLADQP